MNIKKRSLLAISLILIVSFVAIYFGGSKMNLSFNEMSEVVNIDSSNMDTDNDNIEGYNEEVAIANPITKSAYIFDKESN